MLSSPETVAGRGGQRAAEGGQHPPSPATEEGGRDRRPAGREADVGADAGHRRGAHPGGGHACCALVLPSIPHASAEAARCEFCQGSPECHGPEEGSGAEEPARLHPGGHHFLGVLAFAV